MDIVALFFSIFLFAVFAGVEVVIASGRFSNSKSYEDSKSTLKLVDFYLGNPTNIMISSLLIKMLSAGYTIYFIVNYSYKIAQFYWVDHWTSQLTWALCVLALFYLLILLEYLPKSAARFYADQIIPLSAILIYGLLKILYYPSQLLKIVSLRLLKIFHIPTTDIKIEYVALDIERLIQEHQASTSQDDELQVDTELFENVLFLKNLKVRECMVPRNEITAIQIQDSIEHLKKIIIETYHSRILVYGENIDDIKGYVHHFDLHKHPKNISDILIPIKVVPETTSLQTLMNSMIAENKNIAWVVNEYGGTAGVVTLEDILEEIFGEIEDEYDNKTYIENQLSKNEYILSGRIEIDRVNEEYNLDIPESEYETLSGMLVNQLGYIPKVNEEITVGIYHFKVLSVSETKIETVKLTVEESTNNSE